ncbi:MAG: SPOR domain-containing protein, partial [Gammaproteobacteria bacterium]
PPGAGADSIAKQSSRLTEPDTAQTILAEGAQAAPVNTLPVTSPGQTHDISAADTAKTDTATSQQANLTVQRDTSAAGYTGNEKSGTVNEEEKTGRAASTGSGPWIINLLSSRSKQDTDRLAKIAAAHGIPVVQSRAIVKGKEYWRLQVTGFSNASEAKDYVLPIKQKLGIKDVWIFRQKG